MNKQEQERLLDQVHQSSGTIGRSMPETITLDGESLPLRKFYIEVSGQEELQEEDRESVKEVLSYLRRERSARIKRIRNREVEYETGKAMVPEIQDLDRAINAFESLEDPSYSEQIRREKIESAQEVVELMRDIGKM